MTVFDVLAICCWRKWPGVFSTTAASQSCMQVVRCGWSWWWESYLASRATRSQVLTKGLRRVAKLSEVEVNVDCIAEEEDPFACPHRRWSLANIKRVRGNGVFAKVWKSDFDAGDGCAKLEVNLFPAAPKVLLPHKRRPRDLQQQTTKTVSGLFHVSCGTMNEWLC